MDKLGDSSRLLGEVLGSFSIESLIKETGKSFVFKAFDLNLKRPVALKVLKPGQDDKRKEQFLREGRRLAELGKHKNITTVYSAGQESGHSYIAMELVEGGDLEDLVARERLSLNKIFDIMKDVGDAVIYSNGKGIIHRDLKLENIRRNKAGGFYVLDFGDRLTLGENYNDAVGLGNILFHLLKSVGKYPGLEKIVDDALERRYDSPEDFLAAFEDYRKSVTRRKMLKIIGGVAVGVGLGAFALGRWSYESSIERVVDKIEGAKKTTNTDDLFGELLLRIIDKKIDWLVESGKIPRGKFPYATTENGSWFLTDGTNWSDGFWPGILWTCYEATGDKKYLGWAIEWTKAIKFDEKVEGYSDFRFYHSHAKAFEVTGDTFFRDEALKAAERFSRVYSSNNLAKGQASASTLNLFLLPYILWAYEKTQNQDYLDIAIRFSNDTKKFNIREDCSTRECIIFDINSQKFIEEKPIFCAKSNSTHVTGQVRAITGFLELYRYTRDRCDLKAAESLSDYFINNLPADFIPFYEINDSSTRDSSAGTLASFTLLKLYELTRNERHKSASISILKALSAKELLSLDTDNYQGLIRHACYKKSKNQYTDSSLIYSDYFYLEALKKLKKIN